MTTQPKIQIRKGKTGTSYRVEFMRNGSRVSKSFKQHSDAQLFSAKMVVHEELASGLANSVSNSLLFADGIDEYIAQYSGKDHNVKNRLNWWKAQHGSKVVAKINRRDIKLSLETLLKDGKSTATFNRFKCAISAVFEYLKDEYDTDHNPARQVKQKPENKGIDRYASHEELERIFTAANLCEWPKMRLLILLAVSTGARRGELINLKWNDIDFTNQTAYLGDSKNGQRRVLPLTIEALDELEKFREIGTGWIFPNQFHVDKSMYHFDKYWYETLDRAKVDGFRFHDLRHTTGSWLAMNNVPVTAIQQILGHKTIVTTQRYVHHDTQHKAQAINAVFGKIGAY
jgi:integrase